MTNHIDGIPGAAGVVHDHITGVSTYRDKQGNVLAVLPLLTPEADDNCTNCGQPPRDHYIGEGHCPAR